MRVWSIGVVIGFRFVCQAQLLGFPRYLAGVVRATVTLLAYRRRSLCSIEMGSACSGAMTKEY